MSEKFYYAQDHIKCNGVKYIWKLKETSVRRAMRDLALKSTPATYKRIKMYGITEKETKVLIKNGWEYGGSF